MKLAWWVKMGMGTRDRGEKRTLELNEIVLPLKWQKFTCILDGGPKVFEIFDANIAKK